VQAGIEVTIGSARHVPADAFRKACVSDSRAGRCRNEVIEQHVLGTHVAAVACACNYVLGGSHGMALVRGRTRALGRAGFIRSAAWTAVAGCAISSSAARIDNAFLEEAEQQASKGNQ